MLPGDCPSTEDAYYHTLLYGAPFCMNMKFMGCMSDGNMFKDKSSCKKSCIDVEVLSRRGKRDSLS